MVGNIFSKRFGWAWFVSLLLLAGFLLISISSYLVSRGNIRDTITESTLPLTSDNVYSEIQRDLLRPVFIASLMAHDTFLRDWAISGELDDDAITRYLHEIKIKYATVTSFFVSEQTQKYYHSYGLLKTVRESEPRDEWYYRVRDMEDAYEINVDPDLANADEMTIFINYRTFDYDGNFIGATGVGLTVNSVNNLISRYEAKYERQIYFTDAEGKIVLRPMNSPLLKHTHLKEIEGLGEHVSDLLNDQGSQLSYRRDGENRLLHCRYVPELDWYLIVEQSEAAMLAPVKEQLFVNISLALLVTCIVAYICIAAIKRQQGRLEVQNEALSRTNAMNEKQKFELLATAEDLAIANRTLERMNREKDDFIGVLAHDLRNPLNSVIGLCDLAEGGFDEFTCDEFIDDIKRCGIRMLDLTERLLDVSRMESFHGPVATEDLIFNEVVESVLAQFLPQAAHKNIHVQINLEQTEGVHLQSHHDWLDVCISNLISNAIKYTPKFGKVGITTRCVDSLLELEISDSGCGIKDDDLDKLFGKFVRLSSKPTDNESSLGLGLYIVKQMSERLGMQVQVHSELGKGTSFTLIRKLG
ncbi:sensor histidine kinase [Coraliomargarita sp. SDUM461003]|uniref:histidine kinase n=1 Tax=Thalassobacterium maritimum TaxID=3041265 RepID=A0ABU1ARN3_9BACT|nr:sensor histidine kinase [Coraliomargarita sp. SDUM461003]MDQ8206805.1 sensor histidine kinase [Coraliomargarita sp. SDUM461003]